MFPFKFHFVIKTISRQSLLQKILTPRRQFQLKDWKDSSVISGLSDPDSHCNGGISPPDAFLFAEGANNPDAFPSASLQ